MNGTSSIPCHSGLGYPETITGLPWHLAFVRNWGFLLILVPLGWVAGTIWLERRAEKGFTQGWTVFTGILVALGLALYLFAVMASASGTLIAVDD